MLKKSLSDDTPSIMTAEINHNTIVVRVHTMQIDEGNRLLFEEELFCSARTNSPLSLVLDLEQVTFLSSSSLSSLVRLRLECIERRDASARRRFRVERFFIFETPFRGYFFTREEFVILSSITIDVSSWRPDPSVKAFEVSKSDCMTSSIASERVLWSTFLIPSAPNCVCEPPRFSGNASSRPSV